jgi:hypothetical protein
MDPRSQAIDHHTPPGDSDRRHLLAPSVAPSVASSRPASVVSFHTDVKDTSSQSSRHSVHSKPANRANKSHRGYPSEEAYLQALMEFGKEQEFFESDNRLIGFYGTKTVEDYLGKQAEERAIRDAEKAKRRAEKEEKKRRKSTTQNNLSIVPEDEAEIEDSGSVRPMGNGMRRMSQSIAKVFARRGST